MTKLKYYEVSVDDDNFAVIEATSPGQAKYKYIQGDAIPYFQGYDNSECPFTDVRVRRLKKLDNFEPDDDFNILKTVINEYGWEFTDGFSSCLYADNYSDENLRHYIKYGEIEDQEDYQQ